MPKIIDKKIRESEIIEATIRCIEKKGITNLNITGIAKEAKFSTGVIYHYFKNKNDLLLAVLRYVFFKSGMDVREVVDPIKSPRKKLYKHVERMVLSNKENPRLPKIQFAYMARALNNPGVGDILFKFTSNVLVYIRSYLNEGVVKKEINVEDIETFAIVLLSFAYGTGFLWTLKPGWFDLNKTISVFQKMISRYLAQ